MAITPQSFLRNPLLLIGLIALALPVSAFGAATFLRHSERPQPVVVKRVIVEQVAEPAPVPVTNQRGWLGVRIATMNPQHAARLGVSAHTRGVLVQHVFENMPAQRAGFQSGDVITHFNGQRVATACNFKQRVGSTEPNTPVRIRIVRGSTPMTLSPLLGTAPSCGCSK